MATEVILLEKVEKLGSIGDVVKVKPGYARNFLLPQNKALRATADNIAYFETMRKQLEKANEEKKAKAQKQAKKVDGAKVILIRQASEAGHLYGSVTSRDIADAVIEKTKEEVARNQIVMNNNFKTIGLFPVEIMLHPEVKAVVTINIARSEEEAETQEKTGVIAVDSEEKAEIKAEEKSEEKSTDEAA